MASVKPAPAGGRGPGRVAQRRRTRGAILAAARGLLGRGARPSVAAVAAAADVSRRTVYQYFPTQEQLLTEAALEAVRAAVDAVVPPSGAPGQDPEGRLEAVVRAVQRHTVANEGLMRTMLRLTVGADAAAPGEPPRRGYRRVEWIEAALAPLRGRLAPAAFERLVSALALCTGFEALLVLRDVRALEAAAAEDVCAWAARALLRAALAEPAAPGGKRSL